MPTFLLKTEPGTFSFADLVREKKATWDGVANAAALIHLRSMRHGDQAFIYHTGDERSIVGLASVVSSPYEDPKQPGQTPDGKPKFAVIDLKPLKPATSPLSLDSMKKDKRFAGFDLLRISRLSVMPVPPAIDAAIRELTGL
ncbi:MAG: EVE domain-containing protein [Phycisphaerales bacterium]